MLKHLAKWWTTQVDIQTLEGLDDRMLADMGLSREVIRRRVRGDGIDGGGHFPPPYPSLFRVSNQRGIGEAQLGSQEACRPTAP